MQSNLELVEKGRNKSQGHDNSAAAGAIKVPEDF